MFTDHKVGDHELVEGWRQKGKWERVALWLINTITFSFPLLFSFLALWNVPVQQLIISLASTESSAFLWKALMAVFYFSWILSLRIDLAAQVKALQSVSPRAHLWSILAVGIAFAAVCAVLMYSPSFEWFVVALASFVLVDILSWRFFVHLVMAPSIKKSTDIYNHQNDKIGLEQLRILERYVAGNWHWYRFAVCGLVLLVLGAVAYWKYDGRPIWGVPDVISWNFVQILGMVLFMLSVDIWKWVERLNTYLSIRFLEKFKERYVISLRNAELLSGQPSS